MKKNWMIAKDLKAYRTNTLHIVLDHAKIDMLILQILPHKSAGTNLVWVQERGLIQHVSYQGQKILREESSSSTSATTGSTWRQR